MPKFSLSPAHEIHLQHAPLAKVIMQVQYSRTPQLVTDAAESVIATALERYPVRRRQFAAAGFPSVVINGQRVEPPVAAPGTIIQLSEPSDSWQVTITEAAVSLETTSYSTRDDFCDRSLELFQAISAVTLPPVVDRVGLRYIDRLVGDRLERISDFIIPELQVLWGAVEPELPVHHSVTDSLIEIAPNERLQVRSGLLPSNTGFDPALPVVPEPSWVLDMDVYTVEGGFPFEADELAVRLRRYASTAYSFFRFATTDVFQEEHSGDPASIVGEVS